MVLIARDFNEETILCREKGNPTPYVSWIGPDEEVKKISTGEARISLGNLGYGKYSCEQARFFENNTRSLLPDYETLSLRTSAVLKRPTVK